MTGGQPDQGLCLLYIQCFEVCKLNKSIALTLNKYAHTILGCLEQASMPVTYKPTNV